MPRESLGQLSGDVALAYCVLGMKRIFRSCVGRKSLRTTSNVVGVALRVSGKQTETLSFGDSFAIVNLKDLMGPFQFAPVVRM